MTVHFWGEKAKGTWILEIIDSPSKLRNPEVLGKAQQHTHTLRHTHLDLPLHLKLIIMIVTWHRQSKRMDTDPLWHI